MNSINPLVLLTNDDGYASPGLRALWRELDSEYETCVVAPAHPKSWIGKALSNSNPLKIENEILDNKEIHVVNDGTPADCANLGIYHLCPRKPDLLISGINIGANFTSSLALASGTVGAALEAAINGVLGIAVSLDMAAETEASLRATWNEAHLDFFAPAARVVRTFLNTWFEHFTEPDVKLINLIVPQQIQEPPRFVESEPLAYEYGSVFEKRGNAYYNRQRGFIESNAHVIPNTDVWTVQHGSIAYTLYTGKLETHPISLSELERDLERGL